MEVTSVPEWSCINVHILLLLYFGIWDKNKNLAWINCDTHVSCSSRQQDHKQLMLWHDKYWKRRRHYAILEKKKSTFLYHFELLDCVKMKIREGSVILLSSLIFICQWELISDFHLSWGDNFLFSLVRDLLKKYPTLLFLIETDQAWEVSYNGKGTFMHMHKIFFNYIFPSQELVTFFLTDLINYLLHLLIIRNYTL